MSIEETIRKAVLSDVERIAAEEAVNAANRIQHRVANATSDIAASVMKHCSIGYGPGKMSISVTFDVKK